MVTERFRIYGKKMSIKEPVSRKKKNRKRDIVKKYLGIMIAVCCVISMAGGCALLPFSEDNPFAADKGQEAVTITEDAEKPSEEDAAPSETPSKEEETEKEEGEETVLEQADRLAAMYDYDSAISLLQEQSDYDTNTQMQEAVAEYEQTKETCVEYPLEEVTHVFYHTLIKDTSKAFDGDSKEAGYNQVMTTIDEFNKITQSMYDKGYVMVSLHDMATFDEDGNMTRGKILLPPGKKPFVLSQDDVSYYHYMDGDGMASRLVVDENGEVKAEYIEDDGSVSVGDYDMVPLIDAFVEEHPDFSYRGRKGILAMTGYNGVLGYRTDIAYKTKENLSEDQEKFLKNNPDFDYEKEVEEATKVADAMKENGWEFASHTWGHLNAETSSAEKLKEDNEKWENYVAPVLGKTDMIIFAFGADIGGWEGYSSDNEKYTYYKSRGYNYYCNVDSSQYWVQFKDNYLRQGRRNLDGYRMYYNPEMLSDLFDAKEVFDPARTTPVPEM